MKLTDDIVALAIIELPEDEKVRCQIDGCARPIYKKVHIVKVNEKYQVIGSKCFQKKYMDSPIGVGVYTGTQPRKLSEEEQRMLTENTERLIRYLEEEFKNAAELEASAVAFRQQEPATPAPQPRFSPPPPVERSAYERSVTCHYCKKPMSTTHKHTPELGYKCEYCTENKASLPLSKSRRYR